MKNTSVHKQAAIQTEEWIHHKIHIFSQKSNHTAEEGIRHKTYIPSPTNQHTDGRGGEGYIIKFQFLYQQAATQTKKGIYKMYIPLPICKPIDGRGGGHTIKSTPLQKQASTQTEGEGDTP